MLYKHCWQQWQDDNQALHTRNTCRRVQHKVESMHESAKKMQQGQEANSLNTEGEVK